MAGERLTVIDKGALLAENMLGDTEVLHTLIAGGQNKDTILKQVISKLGNDTVAQACFLKTIFQNIAKEGDTKFTNRRDAAMAILTDNSTGGKVSLNAVITPLIRGNSTVVRDAYIEAVREQTGKNDPVSGSAGVLLEVGKVIASHMDQTVPRAQEFIDEWELIVELFPKNQRDYINSKLKEIRKAVSSNFTLDSEIEKLKKQGWQNNNIAKELGTTPSIIKASVRRLIADGKIKPSNRWDKK